MFYRSGCQKPKNGPDKLMGEKALRNRAFWTLIHAVAESSEEALSSIRDMLKQGGCERL